MRDKDRTNKRGGVLRRTAAAASLTLVVGALPVALATPASASAADCTAYLRGYGYKIGSVVKGACSFGASPGGPEGDDGCRRDLMDVGVKENHAFKACDLA
ncbi:hypothetical protein [Streptomyces platensis]|uniref:hypothetical protein n=1 Tax=Streptomyces platensis TaxID=58346 RepID=UPI001F46156C|nr:hypothetical protein [Streptomyces platensis]MCF3147272.1 hypothetical protein [Streptomyces platensis]